MIDGRRGHKAPAGAPAAETPSTSEVPAAPGKVPLLKRIRLGARLHAHGVSADQITVFGLFLAAGAGVLIGLGHLIFAVALITIGGLMDALDGAVAKAAGMASKRGAFFDSTSDRIADGFIFGGVAWYFVRGAHPLLALLPFAILAAGNLVSYERAKAESLGYAGKGGLMERAERLIVLGAALAFHWVTIELLWLLLVLTLVTAGQRFVKVWRQATAELKGTPEPLPVGARWRAGRVESRWREWRQSAQSSAGSRRPVRLPPSSSSRGHSRRGMEPLGTRVRRALNSESLTRTTRSGRSVHPKPARRSTARGLSRRYNDSR